MGKKRGGLAKKGGGLGKKCILVGKKLNSLGKKNCIIALTPLTKEMAQAQRCSGSPALRHLVARLVAPPLMVGRRWGLHERRMSESSLKCLDGGSTRLLPARPSSFT